MTKRRSRRLVIDASVTSSASPRGNVADVTPRRCRELLEAVLRICHRIVLSPDLRVEWRAHRSRYASTWLQKMYARKKVVALGQRPQDQDFHQAVLSSARSEGERMALEKDLLLVEAALETDAIVISRDDSARANPVEEPELLQWLEGDEHVSVSRLETEEAPS